MIVIDAEFIRDSIVSNPHFSESELRRVLSHTDKELESAVEYFIPDELWVSLYDAIYEAGYSLI